MQRCSCSQLRLRETAVADIEDMPSRRKRARGGSQPVVLDADMRRVCTLTGEQLTQV
jgi:hypothetical protein